MRLAANLRTVVLLLSGFGGAAHAQTVVNFEGQVLASCILTLNNPGVLGMSTTAIELSTEQTGGSAATLAVSSTGTAPTVRFTAPSLSVAPTGYSKQKANVSLKYSSPGGANQAYTSGASQYTSSTLNDTVTLHAKATDSAGLPTGTYRVETTATCQQ